LAYWLLKSEPEDWSWTEQVAKGHQGAEWTGVRNFSAQNHPRAMKKGEQPPAGLVIGVELRSLDVQVIYLTVGSEGRRSPVTLESQTERGLGQDLPTPVTSSR
jgi:hypothetical protein